jgi:hypothetical protein
MSDNDESTPAAADRNGKRHEFSGVGVVFFLAGVAYLLTMDSPAMGVPFVVLGIVFFGMGLRKKEDKEPHAD